MQGMDKIAITTPAIIQNPQVCSHISLLSAVEGVSGSLRDARNLFQA